MRNLLFLILLICGNGVTRSLYAENDDVVIFYHIPKTGGCTISVLLDQHFTPEEICGYHHYHSIEGKPLMELMKYKFFRGHFFFHSIVSEIKPAKAICILRDPVERVLSQQRFFDQYYKHVPEQYYLSHFLSAGNPVDTARNHQCRFLSSYDPRDPMVTDEMHLTSAKYNLEHRFFFVGLTERLDESIWVLYTLMGWEIPEMIPRLNGSSEQIELRNPQLIDSIRRNNWADIELYEFAKALFESKHEEIKLLHFQRG